MSSPDSVGPLAWMTAVLDELEIELRQFVDAYVTSFLAWDLLVFFHRNPASRHDAAGLAMRLGRKPSDIERVVEELAVKGLLSRDDDGVFIYEPEPALRQRVSKFVKALNQREQRLLILTAVLQRR